MKRTASIGANITVFFAASIVAMAEVKKESYRIVFQPRLICFTVIKTQSMRYTKKYWTVKFMTQIIVTSGVSSTGSAVMVKTDTITAVNPPYNASINKYRMQLKTQKTVGFGTSNVMSPSETPRTHVPPSTYGTANTRMSWQSTEYAQRRKHICAHF